MPVPQVIWDPVKAALNKTKHGIDFEEAAIIVHNAVDQCVIPREFQGRYAVAIKNPEWAIRMEKALRPAKRKRFVSIPMKATPLRYNRQEHPPRQ